MQTASNIIPDWTKRAACLIRSFDWAVRLLLLQSKNLAIHAGRGKEAGLVSPIYTPAALLSTELLKTG